MKRDRISDYKKAILQWKRRLAAVTKQDGDTAELGKTPAVVQVTHQVSGRTGFFGGLQGINMKSDITDYVEGVTPHAKLGTSQYTGGISP